MEMGEIIRASTWVVGGKRTQNGLHGLHLHLITAYMDDMVTTTVRSTKGLREVKEESEVGKDEG